MPVLLGEQFTLLLHWCNEEPNGDDSQDPHEIQVCARHALGANGGEGWAERIPGRNMPVAATFDVRFPWMCYYYRDENFNFFSS